MLIGAALVICFRSAGAGGRRFDAGQRVGVVIVRAVRSSGRGAAVPAGVQQAAGAEDRQKEKDQSGRRVVRCCSGLLSVLVAAGALLNIPAQAAGLFSGGSGAAPLLALAPFRAQPFQRFTVSAGRAPSGPFLPLPEGDILSTFRE